MHRFEYRNGELCCEGVSLNDLADTFETPTYVYSANTILDNYRRLDAALAPLDREVCYAIKANSNLSILSMLASEGSGFDIVSGGELFRVLKAGGHPARCTFAGVGKTREEIRYALEKGIYSFNVESEPELDAIESVAREFGLRAPVAIRVNPDVDPKTHKYISTGKSQNKFGIGLDRAAEVYAYAAERPHLELRGVQTHIGSQILDPKPFGEALDKLLPLVRELKAQYGISFFSFGGGVGIEYQQALASGKPEWWEENPRITPEQYGAEIVGKLSTLGLRILFEPGRYIAGNAGVLLATVQYVKKTPAKTFVITDAGMNDLIRPALYEGWHEIVPLTDPGDAPRAPVDVVGPVCESGDFFAQDRELPELEPGDRIAVMSAGAYGFVMASNYNTRPFPCELLVNGEDVKVARHRQTYEDLIEKEA